MTSLQIEEFQKLEMSYLDAVHDEDGTRQIQMMELIFFWLRKQMRSVQSKVILLNKQNNNYALAEVSEMQEGEFTFLQMAMISAIAKNDRDRAVEVEIKMREWIDIQITDVVNKMVRPEFKIINDFLKKK